MSTFFKTREGREPSALSAALAASELRVGHRQLHGALRCVSLLVIVAALLAAICFSWQVVLVAQPEDFAPVWGDAHWIEAADGNAPVAYFRYTFSLGASPDAAVLTLAAQETFTLYVNGIYLGANTGAFTLRAYLYDVHRALRAGENVIALRVANADRQAPALKASVEIVQGKTQVRYGSGTSWLATAQSTLAHPPAATSMSIWSLPTFTAEGWRAARSRPSSPSEPRLNVNPLLYERPLPKSWLTAGQGTEAYFVRQVLIAAPGTKAWLRLGTTGTAYLYLNGTLFGVWEGQPGPLAPQPLAYLRGDQPSLASAAGLAVGLYDISPRLHVGTNILAVHVVARTPVATRKGVLAVGAALLSDLLLSAQPGGIFPAVPDDWHASPRAVQAWQTGSETLKRWPPAQRETPASLITLPYLPASTWPPSSGLPDPIAALLVVVSASALVLLPWLLLGLWLLRPYYASPQEALEVLSLAYLPALALAGLLILLSREPGIAAPFPYSWPWLLLTAALVPVGYGLLWLPALAHRRALRRKQAPTPTARGQRGLYTVRSSRHGSPLKSILAKSWERWSVSPTGQIIRAHGGLIPILLLAAPLVCYQLAYEPYWQDELSSYYAARGIMAHALPFFPSGFLYAKAELYSYLLALWMWLFGSQAMTTRIISVAAYLATLPLLYRAGCYFFERGVALVATAMLAFSPLALIWARQMRMYQQAQLFTLATIWLWHRALQEPARPRLIFTAALCLLLAYLSHEETFIILPALALAVCLSGRRNARRLPAICCSRPWWVALALCIGVIATQLLIAHLTPPPSLGSDATRRPLVSFTLDNAVYYLELLFLTTSPGHGSYPWLGLNSLLALAGCFLALRRRERRACYCVVCLLSSLVTLTYLFTMQADRYLYPLLPCYYLLSAYALVSVLKVCYRLVGPYLATGPGASWAERLAVCSGRAWLIGSSGLLCLAVLAAPLIPVNSTNLFLSRLVGLPFHRHYADYDTVGQYLQAHLRKGDVVIAVAPANCVLYYVGRVDYFFSIDRSLYLMERDAHVIETASGAEALLSQSDLDAVLARHPRVWIVSDGGPYEFAVRKRFVFPPDIHLVFEGYASVLYLRGG